ncbi:hypothetical protein BIW11_12895 [Tropilaelaps mercedesae]|uniref:Uncharacterized protein n=1 Tax=Tropilaelaps mercedesae TaxID=418985 RepID=A0A1V9X5B7_9ACAR|nr:hypothetical protein BIW11_12895 [Tropilaelaps mercedesae]
MFDFDPGHLLTTLAWSPATQLQAEVELLVASSDGTVSLCRWAGNSRKRGWSTSIKHLAKHQGGAVSLHVSPKREIARAVSTGADNSLNLYDTQRLWQVSEKRWLRSAGKFVSFADKEIVLYELDGTLRMYDAFSARPLRVSLYTKRFPLRVACTDNRLATVTLNGALLVFDAPFWHPPVLACEAGHNEEGKFTSCLCMAISPTKRWVALGDAGGYYIQHVHTGEIVQSFSTPHPVLHLSWHSKMTMLAIANGTKVQLTYLK